MAVIITLAIMRRWLSRPGANKIIKAQLVQELPPVCSSHKSVLCTHERLTCVVPIAQSNSTIETKLHHYRGKSIFRMGNGTSKIVSRKFLVPISAATFIIPRFINILHSSSNKSCQRTFICLSVTASFHLFQTHQRKTSF